ncbi:hypothetical protein D3C78_1690430 [compost metagenome]
MHIGTGGIEGDLNAIFQHVWQQAIHTFVGGFQAHFAGTQQALGFRVNADHPDRLKHRATHDFVDQVSADVA